jgi:hypothetical protein
MKNILYCLSLKLVVAFLLRKVVCAKELIVMTFSHKLELMILCGSIQFACATVSQDFVDSD